MWITLLLLLAVAAAIGYRAWSRRQGRARLLASPLTADQRATVARQVPLVRKLTQPLRQKLEGKINLFLDQVEFIGCNGLQVTDQMRLSIAAQACLLVVNSDEWYRTLRTILVYPGAFKSQRKERSGFVIIERETVRTGESWPRGPVILSWAHSERGALNDGDGHNVVLHEFAHQLDDLSGHTDGAPVLNKDMSFTDWARVFTEAYARHVGKVERGHATAIDIYGAEGPEEFFAVCVEVFFERPAALRSEEPLVYRELSKLFRLDPVTWP